MRHGDRAVEAARRQVHWDAMTRTQVREGGPSPELGRGAIAGAGASTEARAHHLPVLIAAVRRVPVAKVADADPSARRGPGSRVPPRHEHCHVAASRQPQQVDATTVHLVVVADPCHRVEYVLLRGRGATGLRMIIPASEVGGQEDPSSCPGLHFYRCVTLFQIEAPRVQQDS